MLKFIGEFRAFLANVHPVKLVFVGYITYVLLGWIMLCLPFSQTGEIISSLDNLFTATSAVSTTGLVTVSPADDYSIFGQLIILLLIQLGGLGYMTFSSFVILSRRNGLSEKREGVAGKVFSLPKSFRIDRFLVSVVVFTFAFEFAGALALFVIFHNENVSNPVWSAVFHSVSSFCTAGFSLNNNSFESYYGNFWLNLVVSVLSYLGAVGFIVCLDVWRKFTNKVNRITLTSKIILHTTLWLTVAGTIFIFLAEPSINHLPPEERLITSFFQTMTSMTTVGFNTMLVMTILMIIGASPSGTGGGLKTTTFSAILGIMRSTLRGESEVRFWGRTIPKERVQTAVSSLGFYVCFLLLGALLLTLTESIEFEKLLFEAASALGTVGLSTGITSSLTSLGRVIIIFLMFSGRLGPLTFGMALFLRPRIFAEEEDDDLAI
jgi:trk system potassium uptake protein TrkH